MYVCAGESFLEKRKKQKPPREKGSMGFGRLPVQFLLNICYLMSSIFGGAKLDK